MTPLSRRTTRILKASNKVHRRCRISSKILDLTIRCGGVYNEQTLRGFLVGSYDDEVLKTLVFSTEVWKFQNYSNLLSM